MDNFSTEMFGIIESQDFTNSYISALFNLLSLFYLTSLIFSNFFYVYNLKNNYKFNNHILM